MSLQTKVDDRVRLDGRLLLPVDRNRAGCHWLMLADRQESETWPTDVNSPLTQDSEPDDVETRSTDRG
jgi:hypothetical protein